MKIIKQKDYDRYQTEFILKSLDEQDAHLRYLETDNCDDEAALKAKEAWEDARRDLDSWMKIALTEILS